MDWHIFLLVALTIFIIACAKLVRNIRQTSNDEDLEYFSRWR